MGILTKETLSTRIHVKNARNLFIDVSDSRKFGNFDKRLYSILNYPRIAREMYEFIKGYIECKASGKYKYKDTAVGTTILFYNNMFKEEKYRKRIHLDEFDDLTKEFLEWTEKLQDIMDAHLNELDIDSEMKTIFELTNNQYRKLARVNRDDMEIFLWLVYKSEINPKTKREIPGTLRAAFLDDSTPVMHEIKRT
jgi:hypothetical protein